MIIVVLPSFEDHCAGNKDPETDGGPSEQTHKPKGPSIKVSVFLWGWFVKLVLTSPCLSSGNNLTKHTNTKAFKTTTVFEERLGEWKALDQMDTATSAGHNQAAHSLLSLRKRINRKVSHPIPCGFTAHLSRTP